MINFGEIKSIYLALGYTDLRKGIDGYASIIQDQFTLNPFDDALYIFCNKHRDKLKCLYWDGTGFWLLYKRLDKGHFKWKKDNDGALVITHQQLQWLLDGLKIEQALLAQAEDSVQKVITKVCLKSQKSLYLSCILSIFMVGAAHPWCN